MTNSKEKGVVLIVDDIPTNLEVLFEVLSSDGFRVLVAVDGESAIEQVEYGQPDIILLDVMMPGMDGFETCRQLKMVDATKDIPIIFMTALSETVDKVKGFALGAVDYITKPLQHEEVLVRVTTHLALRNLRRELQEMNNKLEERVARRTAELVQVNSSLEAEIIERKKAEEELSKTNKAYSRFVPKELLQLLDQESIIDVKLGDQVQMNMTVLFSDIRFFTTISEQMTPQENFNFLNAYLRRVSPIIRQHNGFIDKYIGDAIMALFPGSPDDAIQAAIAMQREVAKYSLQRKDKQRPPIKIGIGIHTGNLMLGTIGEQERMEGTVISDAVNQASRMEGLTKQYNATIITSDKTLNQTKNPELYNYRILGLVQVKGKKETISIFELFDGDTDEMVELKKKTKSQFEQALSHYHDKNFDEASMELSRVLSQNPEDKAAQIYMDKITHLIEGITTEWTETDIGTLTEK